MSEAFEWRLAFRTMLTRMQTLDAPGMEERNRRIGASLVTVLRERPGLWLTFPGGGDDPIVDVEVPGVRFAHPRVDRPRLTYDFHASSSPTAAWVVDGLLLREPDVRDPAWSLVSRDACLDGTVRGILLPGLGFDRSFYRMGRGSGFYERFLAELPLLKIGVAFSEQLVDAVPGDDNDVRVDGIITDKEVLWAPPP